MTTIRTTITILFLSLFLISCKEKPTESTPLETKISGKITNKDDNSTINGAQITTSPTTSAVSSDASGQYTISDVKPGSYTVSAAKSGFKPASISVNVVEGKTASADIQLEAIKPELSVSVPSLDFGSTQTTGTFILTNSTSVGTINYSIAKSVDWLSLSTASGSITNGTATITVTASRTSLSFGNYNTILSITSNAGNKDVAVTMTVANPNAPQLTVSPLLLDFSTNLSQLTFTIRNSGTGKIDWAASSAQQWITILPMHDSTRTEIDQVTVMVNRNSLSPADYTGAIDITSNAGSQTVNVKMNVPAVPSLSLSANSLDFDSTKTQLSFNVDNAGTGSLNWNASGNQSWMTVAPQSGTNSGTVNVTISRSALNPGSYSGTVSITSNGGSGSVAVNIKVIPPPPPQPVTVTAGAVTTTSIAISWTASSASDFSAYKVYYSTSAGVSENSTLATTILNKATTSYTVTGLTSNTIYYFRVFVLSSSQQTTGSNTVQATTVRTLPTWNRIPLPVGFHPSGIAFIAENNIWIVGYETISNYNFPRVYQFNGSQWIQSLVQAQDSTGTVTGIAFRNTEGYISVSRSSGYSLNKFNGTTWTAISYLTSYYFNISDAVATTTDAWFYGSINENSSSRAGIIRWNGSQLTQLKMSSSAPSIKDLTFFGNYGFAIDTYTETYFFDGAGWTSAGYPSGNSNSNYSTITISGTSKNDIWASGGTNLYHFDGTTWKRINDVGGTGIDYRIAKMRMISPTDGWATSVWSPYMYHYDGISWNLLTKVTSSYFDEMYDFGNGNIWGRSGDDIYRLQ